MWRVINGKITGKECEVADLLNFYKQLGIIEYKENVKEKGEWVS